MKVGLFGGSFNPVHNGHLALVRRAMTECALDEVIVIPAATSPFKVEASAHAGPFAYDRLLLVRAAFNGMENVVVDDREIRRGGVSFAIDTVREIKNERPTDELIFLIGADSESGLPRWKNYDELKQLCSFHVLPRTIESSTEVRARLAKNESLDDLVPEVVANFLRHRVQYSSDEKIVRAVLTGLAKKGGYCPCRLAKTSEYFCPCDEFKAQLRDENFHGLCHCRLYFKP